MDSPDLPQEKHGDVSVISPRVASIRRRPSPTEDWLKTN